MAEYKKLTSSEFAKLVSDRAEKKRESGSGAGAVSGTVNRSVSGDNKASGAASGAGSGVDRIGYDEFAKLVSDRIEKKHESGSGVGAVSVTVDGSVSGNIGKASGAGDAAKASSSFVGSSTASGARPSAGEILDAFDKRGKAGIASLYTMSARRGVAEVINGSFDKLEPTGENIAHAMELQEKDIREKEADREKLQNEWYYRSAPLGADPSAEAQSEAEYESKLRTSLEEVDASRAELSRLGELYRERYARDMRELSDDELDALIENGGSVSPLDYLGSSETEKAVTQARLEGAKGERYQRQVVSVYDGLSDDEREAVKDVAQAYDLYVSFAGDSSPYVGVDVGKAQTQLKYYEAYENKLDRAVELLEHRGYDKERVRELADYSRILYDRESAENISADVKSAGTGELVLDNLASIPLNLGSGLGQLDITLQTYGNYFTKGYRPVNYYSSLARPGYISREVRSETSDRIDKTAGPVVNFVYNTAMSIADSTAAMACAGNVSYLLLSGSAGLNAIYDAKERGGSDIDAVNFGIASAVSEALFEKISVDRLFSEKDIASTKDAIVNVLMQSFVEGTEEVNTTLFNTVADKIIMGDKSEIETNIRKYREEGADLETAQSYAFADYMLSLGLDFLGGYVSGTLFGGVDSMQRLSERKADENAKARREEANRRLEAYETAYMSEAEKRLYATASKSAEKAGGDFNAEYEKARSSEIQRMLKLEGATDATYSLKQKVEALDRVLRGEGTSGDARTIAANKSTLAVLNTLAGEDIKFEGHKSTREAIERVIDEKRTKYLLRDVSAASKLSTLGKIGYETYGTSGIPSAFIDDYMSYYDAGAAGSSLKSADKALGSSMPDSFKTAAFFAGLGDRSSYYASQNASASSTPGLIENEGASVLSDKQRETLDNIGRALGVSISAGEELKGGLQAYYEDGNIVLGRNASDALDVLTAHEVTHRLAEASSREFMRYSSYITSRMMREGTLESEISRIINAHAANGITIDRVGALEEIAANYTSMMYGDGKLFESFAKKEPDTARTLSEQLKRISSRLRAYFDKSSNRYGLKASESLRASELWQNALDRASRKSDKATKKAAEGLSDGTRRYSITDDVESTTGEVYENVVMLDASFLKRNRHGQSKAFAAYVHDELAGSSVTVKDENGADIKIEFAGEREIVKKDGANRSHKAIDELARADDYTKRLLILNVDELIKASKPDIGNVSNEKKHQWLDANGWVFRKVVATNEKGMLYEALLNVARARDGRNILYDITKIRRVGEIKNDRVRQVPLRAEARAGRASIPDHADIISRETEKVNSRGEKNGVGEIKNDRVRLVPSRDKARHGRASIPDHADIISRETEKVNRRGEKNGGAKKNKKASLSVLSEKYANIEAYKSGDLDELARKKLERKGYKEISDRDIAFMSAGLEITRGDLTGLRRLFREAAADPANAEKRHSFTDRALELAVLDAMDSFGLKSFEYDADAAEYANIFARELINNIAGGYKLPLSQTIEREKIDVDRRDADVALRLALEKSELLAKNRSLSRSNAAYQKRESGHVSEMSEAYARLRETRDELRRERSLNKKYEDELVRAERRRKLQEKREGDYIEDISDARAELRETKKELKRERSFEEKYRGELVRAELNRRQMRFQKEKTELLNLMRRLSEKKRMPESARASLRELIGDYDLENRALPTGAAEEALENEIRSLRDAYSALKDEDPDYEDAQIEASIARLERVGSQKHVEDLNEEETRALTKALKAILHGIKQVEEDKFISFASFKESATVSESAMREMELIRNAPAFEKSEKLFGKTKLGENIRSLFDGFANNFLMPTVGIKRIVGYDESSLLLKLTKSLDEGQDIMLRYQMKAEKLFAPYINDDAFVKGITGRKISVGAIDENGMKTTVDMPAGFFIGLVRLSENAGAMRHMSSGGIVVPDFKAYSKKLDSAYDRYAHTYKFVKKDIEAASTQLTKAELDFSDKVAQYYNSMDKKAINTVSLKLLGYEKATDANHYPIAVDRDYLKQSIVTEGGDGIPTFNFGGLKERKLDAKNPILLYNVTDVLSRSIRDTSRYYGLAIPMKNFKRFYSSSFAAADMGKVAKSMGKAFDLDNMSERISRANKAIYDSLRARGLNYSSIRASLSEKWGDSADEFIRDFLCDLGGTRRKRQYGEGFAGNLRGKYARSVLSLNLSSTAIQLSGLMSAGSVLGIDNVTKAYMVARKKSDAEKSEGIKLDALISRYSPLYWVRAKGYAQQELGSVSTGQKTGVLEGAVDRVLSSKHLDFMTSVDLWTARSIWKAAEFKINSEKSTPRRGSDEYYKAVAKEFEEAIKMTQPNSTAMQRPRILRQGSRLEFLTFFKTQAYANLNTLYDAFNEYRVTRQKLMYSVPKNDTDARAQARSRLKKLSKRLRDAIFAQILQNLITAVMRMLSKTAMRRTDDYEDENGRITAVSAAQGVLSDFGMATFEPIPFLDIFANSIESLAKSGSIRSEDAFSDTHFEMLNDAIGDAVTLFEDIANDGEITGKKLINALCSASTLYGIPLKNVMNIAKMPVKIFEEIRVGGGYAGKMMRLSVDDKLYTVKDGKKTLSSAGIELMAKAYLNDREAYALMAAEIKKDGCDVSNSVKRIKNKIAALKRADITQ